MGYQKIVINEEYEFECFSVIQSPDCYEIYFNSTDFSGVQNALKDIRCIDLYDSEGFRQSRTTDYDTYASINYIRNYTMGADSILHDAISVTLKKASLSLKIQELDKKVNGFVDESSMGLDEYRDYKISLLGGECRSAIYAGTDVITSKGAKHFSYTDEDQRNLKTLFDTAYSTRMDVPYHADGDSCAVYAWQDIVNIYATLQSNLLYHTTYCNALNMEIRSLSSKEEISAIHYGQDVPEELVEGMNAALAQGQAAMDAILVSCGLKEPDDEGSDETGN